jgi:hypothetical protein
MGRMYSAGYKGIAVTAASDLIEIAAPSDAVVVLHEVTISQDEKDASEQLMFSLSHATGSGSGGSTVTPTKHSIGDSAFGGTVERNNSSAATGLTEIKAESVNALNGLHWLWTPETRPEISPSGMMVFRIEAAPAASMDFSVSVTLEEIGG